MDFDLGSKLLSPTFLFAAVLGHWYYCRSTVLWQHLSTWLLKQCLQKNRWFKYVCIYEKKLKQPQTLEVLSQIAVLELTIFFLSVLTFSKIGQVGVLKKEQLPFFEEVKQTKTHKLKSEVDWQVLRRASITETHLDGLWLFLVFQGDCWHGFSFGTSVWL